MAQYKLIIVSNRLPISVSKEAGKLVYKPSAGGLATALSAFSGQTQDRLWIGWPGISLEDITPAEKTAISRQLKKYGCQPVYLNDKQIRNYYNGYCNDTLWPLFHYFQSLVVYRDSYWEAYKEVNDLFARAVAEAAKDDATVWVHDYLLMLLPTMLRQTMPNASIGFFLHIPFPSNEIFRLLPNRRELLKGLMGADLIGFHIYDYVRHFLSSASRILGLESHDGLIEFHGRLIKVDAFPLGIDYDKFSQSRKNDDIQKQTRLIKESYSDRKIVMSVDRLDYNKGILQRLKAFELLLREHPELIKKISLIMVTPTSRTKIRSYKQLKEEVDQAIGRINGRFATADWTPIIYQAKNLPFVEIAGLYGAADIALVTPLRDGMNLVAKEYVATRQDGRGVLILSEMAGAADELQEALHVNPNDVRYVKDTLLEALQMPDAEQQRRLSHMQRRLAEYTVHDWAADFMEQLRQIKELQAEQSDKLLDARSLATIVGSFRKAKSRLVILDYDGTIQKYIRSPDPQPASPSKELLSLLKNIMAVDHTRLCIVSGRSRAALDLWFGDLPIELIAEHGAWVKIDGKWQKTANKLQPHKKQIREILRSYARRTVGSLIEEKDYSLVWHYRNVPPELAYARKTQLKRQLDRQLVGTGLSAHFGNMIIEIKPRKINKGNAVRKLLEAEPPDFILCIGDDYTDEDMFKVLPKTAFTIKVGLEKTNAHYRLPEIVSVHQLLHLLVTSE